jgi:hypothetical protein
VGKGEGTMRVQLFEVSSKEGEGEWRHNLWRDQFGGGRVRVQLCGHSGETGGRVRVQLGRGSSGERGRGG